MSKRLETTTQVFVQRVDNIIKNGGLTVEFWHFLMLPQHFEHITPSMAMVQELVIKTQSQVMTLTFNVLREYFFNLKDRRPQPNVKQWASMFKEWFTGHGSDPLSGNVTMQQSQTGMELERLCISLGTQQTRNSAILAHRICCQRPN